MQAQERAQKEVAEAEERSKAQLEAAVGPGEIVAAQALEEQARAGAANWLREQVRQIERRADERLAEEVSKARAEGEALAREQLANKLAGDADTRLTEELERVRKGRALGR